MLRKNPGFTLVAIGSLAIGIGATSASFSIADVMLTRPLPVPESGSVVAITPGKMGASNAANASDTAGGLCSRAAGVVDRSDAGAAGRMKRNQAFTRV